MLTFVEKYGFNVNSQNKEDGVIAEIIKRIKPKNKTAVEFGCPSFDYCSNTALLAKNGWDVTMYDRDYNPDPRIIEKKINVDNINEIGEPTLLSIDIDNDDYHIWAAYDKTPDIVIIEINSSIPPMTIEVPGNKGASYHAMVILGLSKGYFLLCHTGNLVFVLMKYLPLFPEVDNYSPVGHWEKFFNKSFL